MFPGRSLVAVLVVPGQARHEFLSVGIAFRAHLVEEGDCGGIAERGGETAMVEDFHITVLPDAEGEAAGSHSSLLTTISRTPVFPFQHP